MVLATSALLALLSDDADAESFRAAIEHDPVRLVSVVSLTEAAMTIEAKVGDEGGRDLDELIRRAGIRAIGVDDTQAAVARAAFRRFRRGRHIAGLTFGDAFAYALSQTTGEPLLFKGDDLALTDVAIAPC
jgi:ribonuclease VapC